MKNQYVVLVRPRWGRKADLPEKICAACGRPFAWRRKWRRDWDSVRYCSERCRRRRGSVEGMEAT
ncbi:DUF2256 domain-containing protein [Thioalkalivibrio sp.]|uniref:DUF2256 domain-containing protein n=1 Tax=Thioalkalivibrio sp. TaxID=2093813 RepID=UPI0039771083